MVLCIILFFVISLELLFIPLYLKAVKPNRNRRSLLLKMVCSTLFVCAGILATEISGEYGKYAKLILTGFILGWFGDLFLHIEKSYCTLAGLASFLCSHFFYIAAYSSSAELYFPGTVFFNVRDILLFLSLTLIATTLVIIGRRQLKKATIPIMLYCAVLILMFVKAISLCLDLNCAFGFEALPVCASLLGGVILFVLSDILLAVKSFFGKNNSHLFTSLNIITYYAAQHLLALTIILIQTPKNFNL